MIESYDSEAGARSMESVAEKSRTVNARSRPQNPVFFSGSAAQDTIQEPYNAFVSKIYDQLDEDERIVDSLETMMKAVHARIVDEG